MDFVNEIIETVESESNSQVKLTKSLPHAVVLSKTDSKPSLYGKTVAQKSSSGLASDNALELASAQQQQLSADAIVLSPEQLAADDIDSGSLSHHELYSNKRVIVALSQEVEVPNKNLGGDKMSFSQETITNAEIFSPNHSIAGSEELVLQQSISDENEQIVTPEEIVSDIEMSPSVQQIMSGDVEETELSISQQLISCEDVESPLPQEFIISEFPLPPESVIAESLLPQESLLVESPLLQESIISESSLPQESIMSTNAADNIPSLQLVADMKKLPLEELTAELEISASQQLIANLTESPSPPVSASSPPVNANLSNSQATNVDEIKPTFLQGNIDKTNISASQQLIADYGKSPSLESSAKTGSPRSWELAVDEHAETSPLQQVIDDAVISSSQKSEKESLIETAELNKSYDSRINEKIKTPSLEDVLVEAEILPSQLVIIDKETSSLLEKIAEPDVSVSHELKTELSITSQTEPSKILELEVGEQLETTSAQDIVMEVDILPMQHKFVDTEVLSPSPVDSIAAMSSLQDAFVESKMLLSQKSTTDKEMALFAQTELSKLLEIKAEETLKTAISPELIVEAEILFSPQSTTDKVASSSSLVDELAETTSLQEVLSQKTENEMLLTTNRAAVKSQEPRADEEANVASSQNKFVEDEALPLQHTDSDKKILSPSPTNILEETSTAETSSLQEVIAELDVLQLYESNTGKGITELSKLQELKTNDNLKPPSSPEILLTAEILPSPQANTSRELLSSLPVEELSEIASLQEEIGAPEISSLQESTADNEMPLGRKPKLSKSKELDANEELKIMPLLNLDIEAQILPSPQVISDENLTCTHQLAGMPSLAEVSIETKILSSQENERISAAKTSQEWETDEKMRTTSLQEVIVGAEILQSSQTIPDEKKFSPSFQTAVINEQVVQQQPIIPLLQDVTMKSDILLSPKLNADKDEPLALKAEALQSHELQTDEPIEKTSFQKVIVEAVFLSSQQEPSATFPTKVKEPAISDGPSIGEHVVFQLIPEPGSQLAQQNATMMSTSQILNVTDDSEGMMQQEMLVLDEGEKLMESQLFNNAVPKLQTNLTSTDEDHKVDVPKQLSEKNLGKTGTDVSSQIYDDAAVKQPLVAEEIALSANTFRPCIIGGDSAEFSSPLFPSELSNVTLLPVIMQVQEQNFLPTKYEKLSDKNSVATVLPPIERYMNDDVLVPELDAYVATDATVSEVSDITLLPPICETVLFSSTLSPQSVPIPVPVSPVGVSSPQNLEQVPSPLPPIDEIVATGLLGDSTAVNDEQVSIEKTKMTKYDEQNKLAEEPEKIADENKNSDKKPDEIEKNSRENIEQNGIEDNYSNDFEPDAADDSKSNDVHDSKSNDVHDSKSNDVHDSKSNDIEKDNTEEDVESKNEEQVEIEEMTSINVNYGYGEDKNVREEIEIIHSEHNATAVNIAEDYKSGTSEEINNIEIVEQISSVSNDNSLLDKETNNTEIFEQISAVSNDNSLLDKGPS